MIKLVVFLGNPGSKYEFTRHNIGWLLANHFTFSEKLKWKNKFQGELSDFTIENEKVYFLKPLTFMNLSGESVFKCAQFFKIKAEEILVVHDEVDFDFGKIAFKFGGGLAGHNGLRSMDQQFGTKDFWRLRLGISRAVNQDLASYVLSQFSQEEMKFIGDFLDKSADAVEDVLKGKIESKVNKYNNKNYVLSK